MTTQVHAQNRKKGGDSKPAFPSHYHYAHEVVYPSGLVVLASSLDNYPRISTPDRGLYADYKWRPTWRSEFINWPDFGLPEHFGNAVDAMADAWLNARDGMTVEVGCDGGHGRTGTVLACIGVLDGLGWKQAINFVRGTYCARAIETDEQEWFVNWTECFLDGTAAPDKPKSWLESLYDKDPEFAAYMARKPVETIDQVLGTTTIWKDLN